MTQPLGRIPRHIPLVTALLAILLVRCDSPPPSAQPSPASAPATQPATRCTLDRAVRIVLLREASRCLIDIRGPFDVVDADHETVLATLESPVPLTAIFGSGVVQFAELGRHFAPDVIDLRPRAGGTVGVRASSEALRRYRGDLRLIRRSADTAAVLNILDMEDYLLGVVPAEVPADFDPAACRAQAIIARTFAWYQKRFYGATRDWDLHDTESSQVYRDSDSETPAAAKAVRDTRGIVIAWASPAGDRIFPAYYSSTCGGVSRIANQRKGEPKFPVLAGDVRCDFCASSPKFRWGPVTLSKKLITERLREKYPRIAAIGPITNVEITRRTALGRPLTIEVADASNRRVPLDVFDFQLGVDPTGRMLRSNYFTPIVQRDSILFTDGRGYGHGWGLCQFGANTLARSGKTATDILHYYYPGCRLIRAY